MPFYPYATDAWPVGLRTAVVAPALLLLAEHVDNTVAALYYEHIGKVAAVEVNSAITGMLFRTGVFECKDRFISTGIVAGEGYIGVAEVERILC